MVKQKKFIFDWDRGNITKNLKHGVSVEEQEEVFYGIKSKRFDDPRHSSVDEKRFLLFGETKQGKRLVVAFTIRDGRIRPISARPMKRREAKIYEEAITSA